MGLSGEFWAAIAGAVVGGLMSAFLQWLSARATAKEKTREERTRQQGLARTLLFKVIKIESDFIQFKEHVDECRRRAKAADIAFGWATLIPLANLPRPVDFTPAEMGTLISFKKDDLFNDILGIDEVHNGALETIAFYRSERMALSNALPADMHGMMGTIELTKEEYRKVAPKFAELDQLANEIAAYVDGETAKPLNLATRLTQAINSKFGLKIELHSKRQTPVVSSDGSVLQV